NRYRTDRVVDAEPLLDEVARIDDQRASKHRDEVIEAWRIDISAGRDRDHAGEASGKRPERIATAGEVPSCEAAGEPDRDRKDDRRERRRVEVDVSPPGQGGRLYDQARRVEAVEPGEDEHQAHQG